MYNKAIIKTILFFICLSHINLIFAQTKNTYSKTNTPADIHIFFLSAESCEEWSAYTNIKRELGASPSDINNEACENLSSSLIFLKKKYHNNKNYLARLSIYYDTIEIYEKGLAEK